MHYKNKTLTQNEKEELKRLLDLAFLMPPPRVNIRFSR